MDETQLIDFERLVSHKFPSFLIVSELGLENEAMVHENNDDDEDSDAPVIVGAEEIQASMERSLTVPSGNTNYARSISAAVRTKFPLLVAAAQPHEDILMTCARALDSKLDVSLVREAAAYLEQVERTS